MFLALCVLCKKCPMLGKKTNQITYNDLLELLNSSEFVEGHKLDFKRELVNKPKDIVKYVSSFANANGGFLIYGVDDDKKIVGIDRTMKGKNVVEWYNQVVSGNTEPDIFYHDPHCIDIPNSNKIIMIIEIPESTRKPHMVTGDRYYTRLNDSSKSASHYQVRDMFMYSRERKLEFESFYKKRNLDIESEEFMNTQLSKNVDRKPIRTSLETLPLILFSVIPKYLDEEVFKGNSKEQINWLESHQHVDVTGMSVRLYQPSYGWDSKINGYISSHLDRDKDLVSYFEVLTNGYVESGFSRSFCYPFHEEAIKKDLCAVYLNLLVGYSMSLLKWTKCFYDYCDYRDEFLFQLSFKDVLNSRLYGLKEGLQRLWYKHSGIMNKYNDKLAIKMKLSTRELDDEQILEIGRLISDKISRAFGITEDILFDNGQYPKYAMRDFKLYGMS